MDAATIVTKPLARSVIPPAASKAELDAGRVRDIVLVRIATAGKVLSRADLAHDLWPVVAHLLSQPEWTAVLDRDLGALADAGLCEAKPVAVSTTEAGRKRAALVLGVDALPRTWAEARTTRLVAKALGIDQQAPRRLKALLKADGLRAAIVQHAFKLKLRGLPTPARLRSQLATLALSRAFDDKLPADVDGRSGLSAKAGRNLAGRLAEPPRTFPTDSRLVAALAAEFAGTYKSDFESLQVALLRRYVTRGPMAAAAPQKPARASRPRAVDTVRPAAPSPPLQQSALHLVGQHAATAAPAIGRTAAARPDFATFVTSVRDLAGDVAEGWPGNRKAFVSKVWAVVQLRRPEWRVSEIEFKAMLAEAHRTGHLMLANADLKDHRSIAEIQASAIAYKNSIFHYVRVDD